MIPMKVEMELHANPPAKIFLKLTVLGCVLLGFVYALLIVMNSTIQALH